MFGFKYQLVFLGTYDETIRKRLFDLFIDKINELRIPKNTFSLITSDDFHEKYKGNQPTFAIYFGDKNKNFKNINEIKRLIEDRTMILPVYFTEKKFEDQIPKCLHQQNGMLYEEEKDNKIVNLILEAFSLLRSSRKIFISYKRSESSSVAIQLYEALEKNNFNVFLDTHSILPGKLFQDELWHRMTDCDAIIVLNTPGFLSSEWCKEEIAEANSKQIGIIQLVWPNHTLEKMAELCVPINLKDSDFDNNIPNNSNKSKLTDKFIMKLTEIVESTRARNLAARQDSLITEFLNLAKKHHRIMHIQPERYISEKTDDVHRIFIPTIGIPQSFDCNRSEKYINEILKKEVDNIYLIYDDFRIKDKWLEHLDWLNQYLSVKTLKKQDFYKWLKQS